MPRAKASGRCANGWPPICAQQGMRIDASQVLITTGSQQGLDLAAKVLIDAGSRVAVETPTYLGALQAFTPYEPSFVPWTATTTARCRRRRCAGGRVRRARASPTCCPTSRTRAAAASAPRAARRWSTRPSSTACRWWRTTPTATCGSTSRRRRRWPRWPEGVLYLGSFSKVLAPGLAAGLSGLRRPTRSQAAAGQAGGRPAHPRLQPAHGP